MTTTEAARRPNTRIIPATDAPEGIRRLAGRTPEVVEITNPDGGKVYHFVIDGEVTMMPPAHIGR